ncbi:hypothetical protein CFD26_100955 [Aspergillus turcosus]|uniref:Fungal N-terminal domain-containing protein n=1 Tax=Aspergillus turcosus TaxID=1245748 RepID=A0A421DDS9_9EURO|nr:hypothetical protein CFD26_100955 [Aspergillus turcosus]
MKPFSSFCLLIAASNLVSALPASEIPSIKDIVQNEIVEVRSLNEANHALQTLDQRMSPTCKRIGKVILTIGTSTAISGIINESAKLAQQICEDQGSPRCAKYVGWVQSALNIAFIAIGYAHGSIGVSSTNEQSSFEPGTARRDLAQQFNFTDGLNSALRDSGYSYDLLEYIDVPGVSLDKRDSEPSLSHRSIARNMTQDDGSVSDLAFSYYDNGDINLWLAGDFRTVSTGDEDQAAHEKRFDGAGFKISLTTRRQSRLTRAHQQQMSHAIANDWASDAVRYNMADYIGLVKTDHTANFYFRIIPETRGFGLNYESVNVCGQLAGFL